MKAPTTRLDGRSDPFDKPGYGDKVTHVKRTLSRTPYIGGHINLKPMDNESTSRMKFIETNVLKMGNIGVLTGF